VAGSAAGLDFTASSTSGNLPIEADELDRLIVVDSFLARPPPELTVLPLSSRS
jgi:hypothetical protein